MARDYNENRNVNAVLGQANIDKYGKTFAAQFGLDGINIVNNVIQPMPNSIVPYLEGDNTITQYAVPINVDELCDYALASFPNIEELTLFSLSMVTFDETNLLSYLPNLETVYVPQSLLSAYQSSYPNITFDEITEDYTYIIEDYTQDHILTSEIITEQLNTLTSQQRNAITKVVIASSYTNASVYSTVWSYNFGTLLPYLNNNIWYNGSEFDFSEYTIVDNTEDHILTASVVETELAKISIDKLTALEKIIVPIDFTSYASGSITELQSFMTTNSIDKLVTTYSGGAMELSLSGEIVTKINDIGKTLDEALVYARTFNQATSDHNNNLIIVPPMSITMTSNDTSWSYNSNLVYIAKNNITQIGYYSMRNNGNLIKIEKLIMQSYDFTNGSNSLFLNCDSLKELHIEFPLGADTTEWSPIIRSRNGTILKITLNGLDCDLTTAADSRFDDFLSTNITRENLVIFINSLGQGKPSTLTLSNTNKNKLTNADIQLLYNKNWALSPTPSAFTFDIGSDTYSCDFGMTWEQWIASAYNVDGYETKYQTVVDSNGNFVKLNGNNVVLNSMIKYGDEYNLLPYYEAFDYEGTLPSYSDYAKYYSDEECQNEVLVANLVIGTTYYTQIIFNYGTNFATDTWEQIKFAYDNGLAQYSLGDTKTITYDNNTYTIRVCDIGARYDLSSGSGKNKATFEFVECMANTAQMNTTNSNNGGWATSNMKTVTMPNIYNDLPSDLKNVISQVKVASASDGSASGSGSLSYSDNYLFLPSEYEIFGVRISSNSIEQSSQFQLYSANNNATFRIKYKIGDASHTYWWECSPSAGNNSGFCLVNDVGNGGGGLASYSIGVAPFFCI